jgi:hypothetical protein
MVYGLQTKNLQMMGLENAKALTDNPLPYWVMDNSDALNFLGNIPYGLKG